MPARTTTASSTAIVVASEVQPRPMTGLQFNESLSWRAGKPIAIADLLRRLQALSKEMREMEQEEDERDSFVRVAKELVSPNLLAHKDKGIRAWTACCLVDILRLCAPDAPYTATQLKDIFNVLISSVLPALSDPSNAYNNQHMYVLQSLATVKSIVLIADIPGSETLTLNLFTSFFDILSGSSKASTGEQLAKNVEYNMTGVLVTIVDESSTLPSDVVDIIVAQFLRTDPRAHSAGNTKSKKNGAVLDDKQSTLVLKELPPAYNMAKTICNSCPEKMARYISQYFNDVIVDASSAAATNGASKHRPHRKSSSDLDDSDDELPTGPTEDDLKELHKAHRLLRELWRASPAVLSNVIPQLEAEMSAENIQLRSIATETLGDMVSGIGAAGLPPSPVLDPAMYPPLSSSNNPDITTTVNLLTRPLSPQSFPQVYQQAYSSFLGRKQDRSPIIRSVWTTAIGRILTTSAGGVGLGPSEEKRLVDDLSRMMCDADERVRVAAVRVVGSFSFRDVISKLCPSGGVTESGSVLATLAERVRDRKHTVRIEAMKVLARIWGVGSGEIAAGDEPICSAIAAAPTKILDTFYANDLEINLLLDHTIFEILLPMSFPPVKIKSAKTNGNSQRVKDSQTAGDDQSDIVDIDKIRTERILILAKNLDEKAKKVFFAIQTRQVILGKVMTAYLQRCEDYNGGVMDEKEAGIKEHLTRLIETLAKSFPDQSKCSADLWKFAKMHDRRCYQLIRFCMAPESDYRTVYKAMKELTKRIETSTTAPPGLLDMLIPLLYRVSLIIYNKSHVPTIMEYSRTDERSLAATAHEILREISSRTPEVLKAHVQEICRILQDEAPSAKKVNSPNALDDLKACASFALKFADEIPHDRKFIQAMTNFALHGTPPETAKYAVSILLTSLGKRELHAKDLIQKCISGFEYGGEGFLSRLASLSQLMLLAPEQVDEENDTIVDIAIKQILLLVRTPSTSAPEIYTWSSELDAEITAKCWSLKILVNRIRSHPHPDTLAAVATPVYNLLSTLLKNEGELSSAKDTPATHKPHLRLLAARSYLKLCTKKPQDALLTPTAFNNLSLIAQDPLRDVRSQFLHRLKKYLSQSKLPQRFYTIPFLLAFEPNAELFSETTSWIRSRATAFANLKSAPNSANNGKSYVVLESVFARLLSLLAHHPDYASVSEHLVEFSRYMIFYLRNVATEENISLIYHIAQRVKQCRDAVSKPDHNSYDSNLHHLSELAQLTIRKYEEVMGWSIQALPGKVRLPTSLFTEIKDHEEAQAIAEKSFLPDGVEQGVETLLKQILRKPSTKKRKSEAGTEAEGRESKKAKASVGTLPIRKASTSTKKTKESSGKKEPKTPKKKLAQEIPSSERRRSGRVKEVAGKSYTEREDKEDDEEMEELQHIGEESESDEELEGEDESMNGSEEEVESVKSPTLAKGKAKSKPAKIADSKKPPDKKAAAMGTRGGLRDQKLEIAQEHELDSNQEQDEDESMNDTVEETEPTNAPALKGEPKTKPAKTADSKNPPDKKVAARGTRRGLRDQKDIPQESNLNGHSNFDSDSDSPSDRHHNSNEEPTPAPTGKPNPKPKQRTAKPEAKGTRSGLRGQVPDALLVEDSGASLSDPPSVNSE